jgi:hypothetical protein
LEDGNAGNAGIVLVGGKGILYPLNEIWYPVNGSYWFGVEFGDPKYFGYITVCFSDFDLHYSLCFFIPAVPPATCKLPSAIANSLYDGTRI